MGAEGRSQQDRSTQFDARALLRAATLAGNCSHPIRLRGEAVNLATGEVAPSKLSVACKDRRSIVCPACSYLYKADAWILVSAGLQGGKGVAESVSGHPRLFVTLTAPSFGVVHRLNSSRRCHGYSPGRCAHGHSLLCRRSHDEQSSELGTPLCWSCFDYEGAVLWNAYSSKLWNRTVQALRSQLSAKSTNFDAAVVLSYLKVAEFQKRGLVHFHAILRADGSSEEVIDPSAELSASSMVMIVNRVLRTVSWRSAEGRFVRWGTQFAVRVLDAGDSDGSKVASYVAKYVVKTTDDSLGLAYRFRTREAIERSSIDPHRQRLALTAWDLDARPELAHLNLRAHAHALGFTGQIITKSRGFSTTFRELRDARAIHMELTNETDPIEGSYDYAGRGYDDPRAAQLAEWIHSATVELRREASQRRRSDAAKITGAPS
jgi:hypothetical protein